jgi:hypothetical protein
MFFFGALLVLAGDIEINPGPRLCAMSIGHINARSLKVQEKCDEISSFIVDSKFDVFAVSETWLDSKTSNDSLHISFWISSYY